MKSSTVSPGQVQASNCRSFSNGLVTDWTGACGSRRSALLTSVNIVHQMCSQGKGERGLTQKGIGPPKGSQVGNLISSSLACWSDA